MKTRNALMVMIITVVLTAVSVGAVSVSDAQTDQTSEPVANGTVDALRWTVTATGETDGRYIHSYQLVPTESVYEQSHTLISSVVTDSTWEEYVDKIDTGTNWKLQQINVDLPYREYTLSITGNGSMTDWTPYNPAPWYGYLRGVTSVSLPRLWRFPQP